MQPDPVATIMQITNAHAAARCLQAVANLGVADALGETPKSAEALAEAAGVDGDALNRVLRLLSSFGIFSESGGKYAHTESSRLLRSDHPHSMRSFSRMIGLDLNWQAYGDLEHTIRTGKPASEKIVPGGLWKYYESHPDKARIFNEAMEGKSQAQIDPVLNAYDFSPVRTIADIGGGKGHLLRAILAAHPGIEGVLFDLPHVVAEAPAAPRLRTHGGDFFKDRIPEADAYLLGDVIHDWNDSDSHAILENIARSAKPGARVLLIETLLPDDPGPHWAKVLDIHMMTFLGGRQRDKAEFASLFEATGFSFGRVVETGAPVSVVEGVRR